MDRQQIQAAIMDAVQSVDLPGYEGKFSGKVRDMYPLPDNRQLIITTDRFSAFDRVIGLIPYKGQVLNQLSAWWFDQTLDIVPNALVNVPDPNCSIVRTADPLPIEVVVRGYITGVTSTSLWTLYEAGERTIYGIDLPDGLQKDDRLPHPIITPTTKATDGAHDERITPAEIVERGILTQERWDEVAHTVLALFARGTELAQRGGLVLVDTKYEFGLMDDGLVLIDEVHTPDSSRYWLDGENYDKEFLRKWLVSQNYRVEGEPPPLPDDIITEAASRYITVYEKLTGLPFVPAAYPATPRIIAHLQEA
jgi:phosphoribosylaminoimidazole-succinocarboxamide synthase